MAVASRKRFQNNLVNLKTGQISREIFVNEEIYQREQEQVFTRAGCSWATRVKSPAGGLLRFLHGRRIGNPLPGPGGRNPCISQLLPAPGYEGLPLR